MSLDFSRGNPLKNGAVRGIWWYIATWFGSGLAPCMRGTFGSLAALPFAYIIQVRFGNQALFLASIAVFIVGLWASSQYLKHMVCKDDPGEIVEDEVAGQWLLLAALFPTWQSYLVGFILFRAFYIVKPWPVSAADQKLKGAFGVMVDDMLAGAYSVVLFWLFTLLAPFMEVSRVLSPLMQFLAGGL